MLSALPLELPPLALEMALVSWLASAFALSALAGDADDLAVDTTVVAVGALTSACDICVCAVPDALPAAVLKRIRSSICGYCQ